MYRYLSVILIIILSACSSNKHISFTTIDTDFSKGRLTHQQTISLKDLEKFHGHLCDGLVVGALAMQQAMKVLYPNQPIDRTNLRIVSKPSPCLTDVAIYITGGRYQFNTFYVDTAFNGLYIVQRIDNNQTVSVSLNKGVKPTAIDSLGNLATQQKLAPCDIDQLKMLEDNFTKQLYKSDPNKIFTVRKIDNFTWQPNAKNTFLKTDILNKQQPNCNK
jgi:acetolactate decarboxylase